MKRNLQVEIDRSNAVFAGNDAIAALEAHIEKIRHAINSVNDGADHHLLAELTEQADIENNWSILEDFRAQR